MAGPREQTHLRAAQLTGGKQGEATQTKCGGGVSLDEKHREFSLAQSWCHLEADAILRQFGHVLDSVFMSLLPSAAPPPCLAHMRSSQSLAQIRAEEIPC